MQSESETNTCNGVHVPNIDIKNDNLYAYNWPGNVRELRNLVERITILSSNESKENINKLVNDILNSSSKLNNDKDTFEKSFEAPLKEARENFEKAYLMYQLEKANGNVSKLATEIGIERTHLYRKLKTLGINLK